MIDMVLSQPNLEKRKKNKSMNKNQSRKTLENKICKIPINKNQKKLFPVFLSQDIILIIRELVKIAQMFLLIG